MTIELMLGFQILADVVLCLAIIVLIRIVNKEIKKISPGANAETLAEFRKLIEDSRRSADYLFQTLNEGRKSLKEIAYTLDEKEKRLKTLIEEPDRDLKEDLNRGKKYEEVVKMAGRGLTEKEIAHTLDLTEGEVCLILDLDRKKNENA